MWHTLMMSWFGTQAHSREFMRKRPAEQTAAWFNVRPYRKQHDIEKNRAREKMQSCSSVAAEWKKYSTASYVKITRLGMTTLKLISSSVYSRESESPGSGMTMIGLTLYWRLMRDFQTKGRGGEKGIGCCGQAPQPHSTILDSLPESFDERPPRN